jgi:hypothetical protein
MFDNDYLTLVVRLPRPHGLNIQELKNINIKFIMYLEGCYQLEFTFY